MAQIAKRVNGKIKIRPDLSIVTLIQEHAESMTAYISERSRSVQLIRPQQARRQCMIVGSGRVLSLDLRQNKYVKSK